jgi:glycerate 2-kinase
MSPEHAPDAREVIALHHLESSLPSSVLRAVSDGAQDGTEEYKSNLARHYLLLDNRSVIEAATRAARRLGFATETALDIIEQPVEEGCAELLQRLHQGKAQAGHEVFCLISGGELACPVRGKGMGGRNAETVLRSALALDERHQSEKPPPHTVVLSAGTDGIDGNSPAAGAIADESTVERAHELKLDARASLEQSDAYNFFHALNDALLTGPTGTNVRDLRVMLAR